MQTLRRTRPRMTNVLGGARRFTLEDVVDDLRSGFYVADGSGNISFANQAFARMLGYADKDELLGLNMAERLYEKKEDRELFLKRLSQNGYVSDYEIRMVRKDGSSITITVRSSFISDKGGAPIGVKGIVAPITEVDKTGKKKEREVPSPAAYDEAGSKDFQSLIRDPLTGLHSYQFFMTCLESEIKRVEWVFHPMSLMMIDIDDFSKYNEKHGQEKGDELLKKMSQILKETFRPGDILCRQAQDQFLAILPEIKRDEALALAKKFKDTVKVNLDEGRVTCSIGLSRFIGGMTPQEFFLQANLGLYMAKEAGKNEACLYG